jgi:predicted nucleic acid-binding protein
MNGKYLLDTNVIISLLQGNLVVAEYIHGADIYLSAITVIELFSKESISIKEKSIIKKIVSAATVLEVLNIEIREIAANYRSQKVIKKTPDAIIAATAHFYNLTLITLDNDFERLIDTEVVLIK